MTDSLKFETLHCPHGMIAGVCFECMAQGIPQYPRLFKSVVVLDDDDDDEEWE